MQDAAHSSLSTLISGRQHYHVTVPGTASASQLSIISFDAVEALGEPYRITLSLTHPDTLERADFLGKPASFHITYPDSAEAVRTFSGCITHFAEVQRSDDFTRYEFVIEPFVARLRLTHASRVYQHKTAPQIIEAVLRHHGLDGNQFLFKTRRTYAKHAFRLQYQQTDWDYIDLLMRQEGLYCYFQSGEFGDICVFADDIDHYIYQPQLNVPYRETAGLEANAETVMQLQTHARAVPQFVEVANYNPDKAWDRIKAEANLARTDNTTYGRTYRYGTHHLEEAEAQWEAQLRHEAELAQQLVYTGQSNVLELRPARILRLDQALPDAPDGQVIVSITHRGARDQAYSNSFTAIPSGRRYRLPLNEDSWPNIAGTLSARVTSPGQYPYAYITKDGHYTVRFDLDFDAWPAGAESVPLRLAKPFAGAFETGFHFPILDGTEAAIAFTDGKSLLQRYEQINDGLSKVDGGKNIRKGALTLPGELKAEEWLTAGRQLSGVQGHMFTLEANPFANNPKLPFIYFDMVNGALSRDPNVRRFKLSKASLSEGEAIALWDIVSRTIRVRPGAADFMPQPPLPPMSQARRLMPMAVSGDVCPESGIWTVFCDGRSQTEVVLSGQPMPLFTTEETLPYSWLPAFANRWLERHKRLPTMQVENKVAWHLSNSHENPES